jgi:hypothetical protein
MVATLDEPARQRHHDHQAGLGLGQDRSADGCPYRLSHPSVLVMESAEERDGDDRSSCLY